MLYKHVITNSVKPSCLLFAYGGNHARRVLQHICIIGYIWCLLPPSSLMEFSPDDGGSKHLSKNR
jgi:hypothetical protein